jgi:hypothetical protein
MLGEDTPTLLQTATVQRGDVWRRVVRTRHFQCAIAGVAVGCASVHVFFGWLAYRNWGKRPFPPPGEANACLVLPGKQHQGGIALIGEVIVDATLTAFFVSGGMLHARINDVRAGRLPLVAPDAFPRGCLLPCLFPRCALRDGRPATRHDHCNNIKSWAAIVLVCGIGWGCLTLGLLAVLWALPVGGPARVSFCLTPWTFVAVRAVWSDVQAVIIASGCYVLWCTRGDRTDGEKPANREPLSPLSPTADFVAVN